MRDRVIRAICVVVYFIALAILLVVMAKAHDDAQWIAEQGLRNKIGEFCCGKGDCEPVAAGTFKPLTRGYLLATGEVIPYAESSPISIDGRLWICRRPDGSRRCVFDRRPGS